MSNIRRDRRSRWSPEDEEEIQKLLTDAGRRPPVPEQDLVRIRAAARAEWEHLVVTRRKRQVTVRRLVPALTAAGLLIAVGVAWWWGKRTPPFDSAPVATVELLKGEVRAQGPPGGEVARRSVLMVGDALLAGTTLVTEAARSPGIVALALADGESVRLDSGTRLHLASRRRLAVEIGTVYVDSGVSATGAEGLEIVTPWGSVHDIGTQFEVRVAKGEDVALRVRVREGEVAVAVASGGESHTVIGGRELQMRGDGVVSFQEIERYGPVWDWTLAAAPSIDIDDRPLSSFLEWVCRETGWELRYADPELVRSAPEIRVRGNIAGLTPEEAVSVVLPASRLDYRVEDGILWVSRTPG